MHIIDMDVVKRAREIDDSVFTERVQEILDEFDKKRTYNSRNHYNDYYDGYQGNYFNSLYGQQQIGFYRNQQADESCTLEQTVNKYSVERFLAKVIRGDKDYMGGLTAAVYSTNLDLNNLGNEELIPKIEAMKERLVTYLGTFFGKEINYKANVGYKIQAYELMLDPLDEAATKCIEADYLVDLYASADSLAYDLKQAAIDREGAEEYSSKNIN